jgi:hypothetical protein
VSAELKGKVLTRDRPALSVNSGSVKVRALLEELARMEPHPSATSRRHA